MYNTQHLLSSEFLSIDNEPLSILPNFWYPAILLLAQLGVSISSLIIGIFVFIILQVVVHT